LLYRNGSSIGTGNDPFTSEYVAQDFTLAQNSILETLTFNVFTIASTVTPTAADIRIYSDVAGTVGSQLFAGTLSVTDEGATGTAGGFTLRDYAVNLPSWALGVGHYYLGLHVNPVQEEFHWTITANRGTNIGDISYASPSGASGTFGPYIWEHEFDISGTLAPPSTVPEPSTLILSVFGAVGIVGAAWRIRGLAS
jgi:hypothetical protein